MASQSMDESAIMLKWAETRDDLDRYATANSEQEWPGWASMGAMGNRFCYHEIIRLALYNRDIPERISKDILFRFARDIPLKVWRVSVLHEHDIQRGHGWGRASDARPHFDIHPTFIVGHPWRPHNMSESEAEN